MPLVPAVCPNCKGTLEVNPSQDAAICRFCGTPFIVEKAINHYNTTNNFNANVVNYYGSSNFDFVIRGGVLEKYNGASTDVVVPDGIVEIGYRAFEGLRRIRSIQIPNSVTVIGSFAFIECQNLSKINIPDRCTTIGGSAFEHCNSLENIHIPNSVTTMGEKVFYECRNLKNVTLSNSLIEIGQECFFSCEKLDNIIIPSEVKKIGGMAFGHCNALTHINIPRSVNEMGYLTSYSYTTKFLTGCFAYCINLSYVDMPYDINILTLNHFDGCNKLSFKTKYYSCNSGKLKLTLAGKMAGLSLKELVYE